MGWIITAVISGIGAVVLNWWKDRNAQKEHDDFNRLKSYSESEVRARIDEDGIKNDANNAKNTSGPDFNTLR